MKPVLDACCGAKMFWFDKADERVVFVDNRNETFEHVRTDCGNKTIEISPDLVADFTKLPFADNSFALVVFDPPHVQACYGNITKYYGSLLPDWRDTLREGFSECFRVLKEEGTLIFKWCETQIQLSEVLSLTDQKPLFGHKVGKRERTHWVAFLKNGRNQI